MIPAVHGTGFLKRIARTYARRGLTWCVNDSGVGVTVTAQGDGRFLTWRRHFMLGLLTEDQDASRIDALYFSGVQLVAQYHETYPVDGVPWEIHDVEDSIAYEAALEAYKNAIV